MSTAQNPFPGTSAGGPADAPAAVHQRVPVPAQLQSPADGTDRVLVSLPGRLDEALAAIGVALDLPEHYGRNLDALLDCLRDLDEQTVLVLDGWQQLAWEDPAGWARLRQALAQREQESGQQQSLLFDATPAFRVESATPVTGLTARQG